MTNPYPLPRETRESPIIDGDGRAGSYGPFSFRIWDPVDVVAVVSRAGGEFLPEPVAATKTVAGVFEPFVATFAPPLAVGDRAVVRSARLHERLSDVTRGGSISGQGLERELSVQGTVLQETRRELDLHETGMRLERLDRILADQLLNNRLLGAEGLLESTSALYALAGEAARIAEAARDIAQNFASDIVSQGNVPIFDNLEGLTAITLPAGLQTFQTRGRAVREDGGDGVYAVRDIEPSHPGKAPLGGGKWAELISDEFRLLQFGDRSDATAASRGAEAARVKRRKLRLPDGDIQVSSGILASALSGGMYVDWEGQGSGTTRLIPAPDFPETTYYNLRVPQTPHPNIVSFPRYGNQTTVLDEAYDCIIAATANLGDYRIQVSPGHSIQAGDILRLKSTRMDVQRCESRGAIFRGELNRAVAVDGNTITLEYPLSDRHFNIDTAAGPVVAGGNSATRINLSGLSLPAIRERMIGARIEIVNGQGAGQIRYVEEIDAAGIANIASRWNSGYPQAPFSPVPNATSMVKYTFRTYISYHRPNDTLVRLKGFSILAAGAPVLTNGGRIEGVVDPVVDDVRFLGTRDSGLAFVRCIRPKIVGGSAKDCNTTSLGYGALFTECRDSKSVDFDTQNCRASIDCSGTIKSVGANISGGSMIGGYADYDGQPWNENNANRGPGDHGQSMDWTWSDITVEGMVNHCVQRGTRIAFNDIRHLGRATMSYYLLAGGFGTTINGHDVDARIDTTLDNYPTDTAEFMGNFIRISCGRYAGDLYVGPGNMKGLTNSFISLAHIDSTMPFEKRVVGPIRLAKQNIRARTLSAADVVKFVETEAQQFIPVDWSIERPDVVLDGPGKFQLLDSVLLAGASASAAGAKMKIDSTWVIAVADDAVVAIPFWGDVGSSQVQVAIYDRAADSTFKGNGLIRRASTIFTGTSFGGATANISAVATVPTGTTGTDGNINLHYDGTYVYVENRSGAAKTLTVSMLGF